MTRFRPVDGWVLAGALLLALLSIWQLERPRIGVEITTYAVSDTPVTRYARPDADGPVVVIAHGFAGSRQMMRAYALTLARAGYRAHAFDFEGHGRHPVPMSGDVNAIDGTTRLLIAQTHAVVEAARAEAGLEAPAALLGHSMATDVIARAAENRADIGPVVGLSMFSLAVTPDFPRDLLLITGQWEPGLLGFAREAVAMVDPAVGDGEVARNGEVRRMAVVAPAVEHVAILHSRAGQRAALDWLDESYGRQSDITVPMTGWWLLALLAALVALFSPVARLLPGYDSPRKPLTLRQTALVLGVPAIAAPLIAVPLDPGLLPVLVADYLALHLLIYGLLQLGLLRIFGQRLGPVCGVTIVVLILWGIGVFGLALDRYGANFLATPERAGIIAALALGAVPFMLADTRLTHLAPFWLRMLARVVFVASLGLAVALDFEGLFFLLMIAPVILLFFLIFGLMGRFAARHSGAAAAGIGLGLVLAWALGVSFPMFSAGGPA